ncbi:uncharacterized protein LOC122329759 isoform X2 [Puntigrus tetrazona]|uniref:uncharacterized protein LOC122329759 isoform X2 n=1 Tax=Puntigrus tetrazona TaxID=1606681 RepID=UPI001C8AD2EB|nr:uncharacterized protein LOC122329759 isoform X2 [Puntigrus tetrazona]
MDEVTKTSQEFSLIFLSDVLYVSPGDEAVLSCHLKPAISAASMEIKWWSKSDLVCHHKDGRVTVNREYEGRVSLSLEDLHDANVSLTLRDVRSSQKGLYICEVIHESQSMQASVYLHVSSEDFRLVTPIGTVYARPGSDAILPVHLSPETSAVSMDVRWFKGTELIYRNRQEMSNYKKRVSVSIQELERGNLALTLRNFQPSDSGDYTCKVFHEGCVQTGIVHLQVREIQRCDDAGHRRLLHVLRQVQNDVLLEKAQLLQGTVNLLQQTLNEGAMRSNAFGRAHRHSNSMDEVPPLLEDARTEAGRRVFDRDFNMLLSNRMRSTSAPVMTRHNYGQNRGQTSEGDTGAHQELVQLITQTHNLLRHMAGESVNVPRRALTYREESPGATVQSIATEQERYSPAVPSQEQERERASVVSLGGEATRISERSEDGRHRTRQRRQSIHNMCQII